MSMKIMSPDMEVNVEQFLLRLKKGEFKHSCEVACETVKLLERVATNSEWEAAKDLMVIIHNTGKKLTDDLPTHTVINNMVLRVLKVIRDEYNSACGRDDECDQPASLPKVKSHDQMAFAKTFDDLKKSIAAHLRELMEELERCPQDLTAHALEHIHFDEVIMTYGYSRTVEKFLKKAASKRKCQVFVAEASPGLSGHTLAKNLAESGIQTTLIPDAAIFSVMSRVNKVIVGTHSIMAHGGIIAPCGAHTLALAAKYHAVSFLVLAPMYKLIPKYSLGDQDDFNHMMSPEAVISFEDDDVLTNVEIINPTIDYVPPELVTLIISNMGETAPFYMYRLLSELYHVDDCGLGMID